MSVVVVVVVEEPMIRMLIDLSIYQLDTNVMIVSNRKRRIVKDVYERDR